MDRDWLVDAFEKHDSLLVECVRGALSVRAFLAANDCFYHRGALDGHEGGQSVLDEFASRIEVYRQVWEQVESRITSEEYASEPRYRAMGFIGEQEALKRLRAIAEEGGLLGA